MSLPASDAFTGTDGTALTTYSSSWTYQRGTFAIKTNSVKSNSGSTECAAYWNADSFDDDQYARGTLGAVATGGAIGPAVRVSTGTDDTYYGFYVDPTYGYVFKMVSGTWTQLKRANKPSTGVMLELRAEGTTISPYVDGSVWTPAGSSTDSAISSGAAGIAGWHSADSLLSDWEGGNLGASAVSVALDVLTAASSLPQASISPGAVSVLLDALAAASSLPAGSIAAAVSILLDALQATSSMPQASITPGAVSLLLDALTLAGSLPASSIAVESGPQTVALDGLSLAGSLPDAQISAAVSILLDALSLVGSMPQASISPGAVALLLDALSLAGSLPAAQISAESGPQSVALQSLSLAGSLPDTQIAATVSILLDALSLAGSLPQASISPGAVNVALDVLTAASSLPDAQISAAVSVLLQALNAESAMPDLEVQSMVSVLVQALTLQSQAPGLDVLVSGGVVNLEVLQLVATLSALVYQKRSSELMHRRGRFTPG